MIALFAGAAGASDGGVISSGGDHTCGIDAAGAAMCWGNGANGRFGDGVTGFVNSPVATLGFTPFADRPPAPTSPTSPTNNTRVTLPKLSTKRSGKAKVKGKSVSFAVTLSFKLVGGISASSACKSGKLSASTKPKGVKKTIKAKASQTAATPTSRRRRGRSATRSTSCTGS